MQQADLDLNAYRVVVMNRNATLSVIDPPEERGRLRFFAMRFTPTPTSAINCSRYWLSRYECSPTG